MKVLPSPACANRCVIVALCLLFWQALALFAHEETNSFPRSRFEKTVDSLQGDETGQADAFAEIALAKLVDAYAGEARLAREQAGRGERDATLWGWSVAVDGYARQISALLDDIESGSPVRIIVGNGSAPAVAVADRIVMLNHPRPDQQDAFEQDILQAFCARYSCEYPAGEESEPIPAYTGQVQTNWSFTERGPSCSHRGLTVRFKGERSLANSRAICEQLMREVEALADALAQQARHAVPIDWEAIKIEATPGSTEHTVRINGAGDVLLVSVPLLYSTPAVLRQVIPWVRRRIDGEQAEELVLDADTYGWQDP